MSIERSDIQGTGTFGDVAPRNIQHAAPPTPPVKRNGVHTFLLDRIPEDHKTTLKALEDARAKLSELEEYRAYLERVAAAAGINLHIGSTHGE